MDIRPWGSACSIVAHVYIRKGTHLVLFWFQETFHSLYR